MRMKQFFMTCLVCLCYFSSSLAAWANDDRPELELVLALDWSASMYYGQEGVPHWKVQRDGHITAIRDSTISNALIQGRTFVQVVMWAQQPEDVKVIFARRIERPYDIDQLVAALQAVPGKPPPSAGTIHAVMLEWVLKTPPIGVRRVVDISTDESPGGATILSSRYEAWCHYILREILKQNVRGTRTTINVLAVGVPENGLSSLNDNVRTPDGFLHVIEDWTGYAAAIRRKILLEIAMR